MAAANIIDHAMAMMPMTSKREKSDRKDGEPRHDAHVKAYKEEVRKQKIRECRDYKAYERKRKGESRVKRFRIKQLSKLIRETLPNATETDVARMICLVDMTYRNHSYRQHVEYMEDHSGSVKTCTTSKRFIRNPTCSNGPRTSGLSWISSPTSCWRRQAMTRAARCSETRRDSP